MILVPLMVLAPSSVDKTLSVDCAKNCYTEHLYCLYCFCSPKVGEALRAISHQEWVDLMEKVFKVSLETLTMIKVGNMNFFLSLLFTFKV